MAHLPQWSIINKYGSRNIWTARYRALQNHKANMGFLRDFLALLIRRGYISVFKSKTMSVGFAVVSSVHRVHRNYV